MNTYENGKIILNEKGHAIKFSWAYTGQRKPSYGDKKVDSYIITVEHNKKEMDFAFFNSIMETELTERIKYLRWNSGFNQKESLRKLRPSGWGGYDGCNNEEEFQNKRVYYLVSGFIYSLFSDISFAFESFSDFCDTFGYDSDSRQAEKTYNAIVEQTQEARELGLLYDDLSELRRIFTQEEPEAEQKILEALEKATQ